MLVDSLAEPCNKNLIRGTKYKKLCLKKDKFAHWMSVEAFHLSDRILLMIVLHLKALLNQYIRNTTLSSFVYLTLLVLFIQYV